ncbi:MAG: hypothetical protein HZC55_02940 [Verrucomicrobia bacterium]|nr:hypothetical protein [Verrucomicrobiota bacterium]
MRRFPVLTLAVTSLSLVGLTSCQSAQIERKAEEYRRNGLARDMGEARRLAENYYWTEAAEREDAARRERSEVFPLPRDGKR